MLVQFDEGGVASDPRPDIGTTGTLRWHHQVVNRSIHPVFTMTMLFGSQLIDLILSYLLFEGCISLTYAHMRSAPGSLGIIRQEV